MPRIATGARCGRAWRRSVRSSSRAGDRPTLQQRRFAGRSRWDDRAHPPPLRHAPATPGRGHAPPRRHLNAAKQRDQPCCRTTRLHRGRCAIAATAGCCPRGRLWLIAGSGSVPAPGRTCADLGPRARAPHHSPVLRRADRLRHADQRVAALRAGIEHKAARPDRRDSGCRCGSSDRGAIAASGIFSPTFTA